jgi:hypothetical protein
MKNPFTYWRERRRRQAVEDLQQEVGIRLNHVIDSYAAAETEPASEAQADGFLAQQVKTVEGMRAVIHVLTIVIATHSNPDHLLRTWRINATQFADDILDEPAPWGDERLNEAKLEAYKEVIHHFTALIERTAQHYQDEPGKHDAV